MIYSGNGLNRRNGRRSDRQESNANNTNKTAKNNFIKVFIFMFLIMVIFTVVSRLADADSGYLVAQVQSPDTDTKIKLQWISVPGAQYYLLYRDSGGGFMLIETINVDTSLDTLTYTDENLSPSTTYRYRIEAYDAQSNALFSQDVTSVATTTPMIRPYNLSAVFDVNSRKAMLSWSSSALAEGSRINRTESGITTHFDTSETSSTEVEIIGSNSVRFTVQTRAESAGYGISAASDPITVVPVICPVLSAEYANDGTVKISWDSQSYINVFSLEYSKWNGSSWSGWSTLYTELSGSSTTHTVGQGGKYRYRLRARSDKGYSGYSNITEYVNNLAAPTELSGMITDAGRIDLSWTNAPGNDGKIQVWRKAGGSSTSGQYTLIAELTSSENTYSDLFTIVPGTIYHYRVNAADDAGHYSPYASASISAAIPAAPSSLSASVVSGPGISLTWKDNSNNEVSFIIERFDENQYKFVEIDTVGSNTTTYTDNTAVPGGTYIYRIRAGNGMGKSAGSNEVTVNAWDAAAPASLVVTSVSSSRLDLSWSYTGTENYNTIIERKIGAEGTWTPIYTTAAGTLKYSDTGLQPGTRYFYRVRKSLGSGVYGVPFPDETGVGAYTKLATPSISGAASSDNSIYISWTATSGADVIIERKMPNGSFSVLMTAGPTVQGWYDNTGLVPGAFYTYRIKAKTSANESLYSDELTIQNYYLDSPTNLMISLKQDSSVVLNWHDTTTDETGFEIWRYTHGSGTFVLYATVDKNITTFTDNKVDKGIQYSYKVRAFTGAGNTYSGFSNTASIGIGVINPPADLEYTYISEYQVMLHWIDTSDNEYGFIVEQKMGEDGEWIRKAWLSANTQSYTVSNLNRYTKYYFRIRAYNYQGQVESVSEEILVTTAKPAAPSEVKAVSTSASQVKITWKDNSDSETGFRILRSLYSNRRFTPVAETSANTNMYYDNTVAAGVHYYYKVEAFSTAGSAESAVADVTTNTRVYFTDTNNVPWAKDAIENLAGMGVINGINGSKSLFGPNNTISKAEFAAMVVRAFGFNTAPVGSLADVKQGKWYYREVMIAENFGIISGDANNRFYPESPITREEIAVMIFKALQVSGRKFTVHDNSVLEEFIDKQNISPHAVSSMAVLAGEGIMEGLPGNTIGPKYTATRAQAAVFVYRALIKSEPGGEEQPAVHWSAGGIIK